MTPKSLIRLWRGDPPTITPFHKAMLQRQGLDPNHAATVSAHITKLEARITKLEENLA